MEGINWKLVRVLVLFIGFVTFQPSERWQGAKAGELRDSKCTAVVQHEVFIGDANNPILFIIEENHAGLSVQRQVAWAIEMVANVAERPVLLVEGSDPCRFPIFGAQAVAVELRWRKAVAEAWFELAFLSGAELAAVRLPDLRVWGVELARGPERVAHWNALQDGARAWDEMISLWQRLREQKIEDLYVLLGELYLYFALEELKAPIVEGLPLMDVVKELSEKLSSGDSLYHALKSLGVAPPDNSFSARWHAVEEAKRAFFKAVVKAAFANGLIGQDEVEELLKRHEGMNEAAKPRYQVIVRNVKDALKIENSTAGILVIGAAHTSNLIQHLRDEGISYVVITPTLLAAVTPGRELERFDQILELQQRKDGNLDPMTRRFALGYYKPSLILANPRSSESFSGFCMLLQIADRALRGEAVPSIRSGDVIESVRVVKTPQGVEMSVVGRSRRSFTWKLPRGFALTDSAAHQLITHTMEALEAGALLRQRADRFFSPAVHFYLEPDGAHGGAFISYMPDASTLVIQAVPFELPTNAEKMLKDYSSAVKRAPIKELQLTKENVQRLQPEFLFRPIQFLLPIVDSLNRILDELGISKDQVVPVVLRMARISDEAMLRDINFTWLFAIAREADLRGFERRLMFVKCGLEPDVEVGSPERWLPSTLLNVHAWSSTQRHIIVLTIPTEGTQQEWNTNPFAQYLTDQGWTLEDYNRYVLPAVKEVIQVVGSNNALRPLDLNDFFVKLEASLKGVKDATVTLSFVGHHVAGKEGLFIHFRGSGSEVPLDTIVSTIQWLQRQGRIPRSVHLEFNVIVCSAEKEAASKFLMELPARLVLAAPQEVGLVTNMRLLLEEASRLGQKKPLYIAYIEGLEALARDIFDGHDQPSTEVTQPSAWDKDDQPVASGV